MRPTFKLEIAYEDPTVTPVWVDETAYFRRPWNTNRGRNNQLDRMQAGTFSFTLYNGTGRFDAANAAGAHYPDIVPMRRVRLSTAISSGIAPITGRVTYQRGTNAQRGGSVDLYVFSGFVESWTQTWALTNGDAECKVNAVDGFKVFNLQDFVWGYRYTNPDVIECGLDAVGVVPDVGPPFIPDDLSGDRITRVLDCIGWPMADRDIDTGTIVIWGSDATFGGVRNNFRVSEAALSHLLAVADTDGGLLFMDTQGKLRFHDALNLPTGTNPAEVYGGQTGEIGYTEIQAPFDESRLFNDITITPAQGANQIIGGAAEDATSILRYYRRELSITLLATDTATLQARADAYLAKYKDPPLRFEALSMRPTHQADWLHILTHELGEWIQVKKRPAGANVIDQTLRIEGISISSGTDTNTTPTVTFRVSAG